MERRDLVDYTLQRRAVLSEVVSGQTLVQEVCNAPSFLVRAATFHGEPTEVACPVCRKENLTHVFWVYGDEIGQIAGSARSPRELAKLAALFGEFEVDQVEICRSCSWNHLVTTFVMGHDGLEAPRRRTAPS